METEKNTDIYYHDIEIYFNNDLVYAWREVSFTEIAIAIKVTKMIYTKLYFVKNKCIEWNYKVVIK